MEGAASSALHRLFAFKKVAVCDDGYARCLGLELWYPAGAWFFKGNGESEVPHRFLAVQDIVRANRWTAGVRRFSQELDGWKYEIVRPHRELGLARRRGLLQAEALEEQRGHLSSAI